MEGSIAPPRYSVVVVFYNEAANIPGVLASLRPVMEGLQENYEVLLVNDGSTDPSGQLIDEAAGAWPEVRAIHFARNIGQAGALLRGLRDAAGEWIFTMDGDGQNDPADFANLLGRRFDADLIVGVRQTRSDSWLRRSMSRLANAVRGRFLGDGVSDSGCGLKLMRRDVVGALLPIRSLYSFIPAMAAHAGFRIAEVPVRHLPRRHGESSYGLSVFFWKPAVDMLALWWLRKRRTSPPAANDSGPGERKLSSPKSGK
ncbi:MAG TPA: glycosyltransferase family 2 protein [Chthoniobacterales bacterium]|nr:glycosyltransferase family 2 protein [Chthoniobacterales bacterium]